MPRTAMQMLNRCVVIVKPKQAFVDWMKQIEAESEDPSCLSIEEAWGECTAYLLPEVDDEEPLEVLEPYFEDIFVEELESWDKREELWPRNRTFQMFLEWFEVDFDSMVIDLAEELLLIEEY